MEHALYAVREAWPDAKWHALFSRLEAGYRTWFLREGDAARPTYGESRRALNAHMPELVPVYDRLVELAGGGDVAARLLSLYRPTPYLTGCSQAVWNRSAPMLVRNYDYSPRLWDGVLLHSAWRDRPVVAMLDSLWGVLDGINGAGLSVSLAFGGRRVVGDGFGMPLILRYVLETCDTTAEAEHVLTRVPSHMAYNVTVLDATGDHRTVFVAPDRPPQVTWRRVATNHQGHVDWHAYAAATGTVDRELMLQRRVEAPGEHAERFVERFLEPPLYQTRFAQGWGTLYTAVYRPDLRQAEFRWPGMQVAQGTDAFEEMTLRVHFPDGPSA